jgi:hypothetical protein
MRHGKLLSVVQEIRKIVCDVRYIYTLEMQSTSTRPNDVAVWKALNAMLSGVMAAFHEFSPSSWFAFLHYYFELRKLVSTVQNSKTWGKALFLL